MEQKMEQGTGLTAGQKQLLDLAIKEPYILNTFYLSGGTALSYWYLHHRQSDDLDLFSTVPFDYDRITRWFRANERILNYDQLRFDEDYGFLKVDIHFSNKQRLLIDFHHYTNTTLESGIVWNGLKIDSLTDITVNKLDTIATGPRTRDYVDLYFIFQSTPQKLDSLLSLVAKKFKESIDPMQLSKNLLKAREYTDYPKMLVPFAKNEMYRFYEGLAGSLKSKILK